MQNDLKIRDLIKGNTTFLIAGPCSVESEEQMMQTAKELAKYQVNAIRGGIWKPRTRPGSFEGVGTDGLKWLKNAGQEAKVPVTVEVATPDHIEEALKHDIDILWIGARTTTNPFSAKLCRISYVLDLGTFAISESSPAVDVPRASNATHNRRS